MRLAPRASDYWAMKGFFYFVVFLNLVGVCVVCGWGWFRMRQQARVPIQDSPWVRRELASRDEDIYIVTQEGIYSDGKKMSVNDVAVFLRRAPNKESSSALVKSDSGVFVGKVLALVDVLRRAGYQQVYVATTP